MFLLPTATDELLGSEKWGVGPTVLALQQTPDGWTYGALVNHIWSFAGDDDRNEISNTFIQPFLAKQFAGGRTITLNSEPSYDWIGEGWNAPVNLMYSKVTKRGSQMVSYQGGVRYFIETLREGPDVGSCAPRVLRRPVACDRTSQPWTPCGISTGSGSCRRATNLVH